jgi:flagellar hook protein FlgE
MLSSLTSGVSGLDSFQEQMDVIGNNIANINTTGYKASVVDFADTFSNTLNNPSTGSATSTGSTGVQIGTGVDISGVTNNWSQGAISATGVGSNLAISGNGFFLVKDPSTSTTYATRAGDFSVDANGFLVTDTGERVQGTTNGAQGDIQIVAPAGSTLNSYSINSQGVITGSLTNNTTQATSTAVLGQVTLQNFQAPQNLLNQGNNLYSNLDAAGPSSIAAPGSSGLGTVQAGSLELSNVDLSGEMANLITAQRAFEANSKIITTSNEVLQTVVNMKQS